MASPSFEHLTPLDRAVVCALPALFPELHRALANRIVSAFADVSDGAKCIQECTLVQVRVRGQGDTEQAFFNLQHPNGNYAVSFSKGEVSPAVWSSLERLLDPVVAAHIQCAEIEPKSPMRAEPYLSENVHRIVHGIASRMLAAGIERDAEAFSSFATSSFLDRLRGVSMLAAYYALRGDDETAAHLSKNILENVQTLRSEALDSTVHWTAPYVAHELLVTTLLGLQANPRVAASRGDAPQAMIDQCLNELVLLVAEYPQVPEYACFERPVGIAPLAAQLLERAPEAVDAWCGASESVAAKGVLIGTALQISLDRARSRTAPSDSLLEALGVKKDPFADGELGFDHTVLMEAGEGLLPQIARQLSSLEGEMTPEMRHDYTTLQAAGEAILVARLRQSVTDTPPDIELAQRMIEQGSELLDDPTPLHMELVRHYLRTGQTEEARAQLEQAVREPLALQEIASLVDKFLHDFPEQLVLLRDALQAAGTRWADSLREAVEMVRICRDIRGRGLSIEPVVMIDGPLTALAHALKLETPPEDIAESLVQEIRGRPSEPDTQFRMLMQVARLVESHVKDGALSVPVIVEIQKRAAVLQVSSSLRREQASHFADLCAHAGNLSAAHDIEPDAQGHRKFELLLHRIAGSARGEDVGNLARVAVETLRESVGNFSTESAERRKEVDRFGAAFGNLTWSLMQKREGSSAHYVTSQALGAVAPTLEASVRSRFILAFSLSVLESLTAEMSRSYRSNGASPGFLPPH